MKSRWRNILFWSVVALTLVIYLVMATWSLPRIAAMAGGVLPFDLRPLGYSPDAARSFLTSLPPEGRAFYTGVQHRLDLVFPGLLALSLVLGFRRLAPRGWLGLVLSLIAVAGAGFDWSENATVARFLSQEPTDAAVDLASRLTIGKSVCNTIALTGMLILGARAALRRWRGPAG